MKKKLIITGGLGFIGQKLIQEISKNYEIFIIDKFKNKPNKIPKNIKVINCDLTNLKKLSKVKLKKIDCIIHLAGQSSGPRSYLIPELDLKLNLTSTVNIMNFANKNKIKKIVFTSTFTVYGDSKNEQLSELEKCDPKSFYAISKYASEKYVIKLGEKYKIKWNILRLFNVYGPGQDLSRKDQGLVSIFLDLIRNNNKINVNGSLKRFRDLVYIDDVIQSLVLVIKDTRNPNQIYNVGSGTKTSIKNLISYLAEIFKKKNLLKINISGSTPGDMLGCYANISKIKKDLGYKPRVKLNKGIKLFRDWAEKYYY